MIAVTPDFSKATALQKEQYTVFFDKTNESQIKKLASGYSLTKLVNSAENVISIIDRCNPIWSSADDHQTDLPTLINARQWQINNISKVKKIVAKAIDYKKKYYEKHLIGRITKFVLKCFNMWNNGCTAAITKAEDFLLFWDSRIPLGKSKTRGNYFTKWFLPLISPQWVNRNLDTRNFYNYNPSRLIEFYTSEIKSPWNFARILKVKIQYHLPL